MSTSTRATGSTSAGSHAAAVRLRVAAALALASSDGGAQAGQHLGLTRIQSARACVAHGPH